MDDKHFRFSQSKWYSSLFLIVKWEQKLDTELDGSMLFNDIYKLASLSELFMTETW
jgi:hypothetical protein